MDIYKKYNQFLKKHGAQGWWPINSRYYPGDYIHPCNNAEKFEICVGAILTQNTSWKNVSKTIEQLRKEKLLYPEAIIKTPLSKLVRAIKSSGYYNQKAKKLKIFAKFFHQLKGIPSREQLLHLWGIGEETADSILLYAYKQPEFVVDTYTRRVFKLHGTYMQIKKKFEEALPKDYRVYNEFHALIVAEGKRN